EIHAADLHGRGRARRRRAGGVLRGVGAARTRPARGRTLPGGVAVAARVGRDERPRARRQATRDRRPVRRDARAAGRLLPDRRPGPRRGHRHRRAHPGRPQRDRRGPADHGDPRPADAV
ncbi:MAG: hypothetical protein AVDCRST_MAG64-2486, partial [uncultured Phycisphaerae bacterium]